MTIKQLLLSSALLLLLNVSTALMYQFVLPAMQDFILTPVVLTVTQSSIIVIYAHQQYVHNVILDLFSTVIVLHA
jgi:hypothetical protein